MIKFGILGTRSFIAPNSARNISSKDLRHHLKSVWKTGLVMPAIDPEGERTKFEPSKDPNSPTIMLYGWTGCTNKHIEKYSRIYTVKGYSVIRNIASTLNMKMHNPYEGLAQEVYSKMDSSIWQNSIVFHLLSMNGCASFLALWKLLTPDQKKNVKGIIFDSAPAAHFTLAAYVIANSAIPPNSGYSSTFRILYSALLNSILVTRLISLELRLKFGNNARKLHPYYQLMDTKLPQNLLFLYSESDSVCVAKDIGAFHEEMREQKYNVQAKKWKDSEHVQHLKIHPEEYERLCTEFVEKSCSK